MRKGKALMANMQERVVLEELNRDLDAAQARVERWAQAKICSAADLKEKHVVNVETLRGRHNILASLFWFAAPLNFSF